MANARMISRDFFTSADLEDLGARAKILFAGMIVFADNAGIIRHQPRFFRNTILHGERASLGWIETTLCTFESRSMTSSCSPEGVKCWRITNFNRFQHLNRREGKRREDEDEGEVCVVVDSPAGSTKKPPPQNPVLERLLRDPFGFGEVKARAVFALLREPKSETLDRWLEYETLRGTPAMVKRIQQHAHPDEIRDPIEEPGAAAKAKELAKDESRARALRASTESVLRASEAARAFAAPPPLDIVEELQKRKDALAARKEN